MKQLPIIFNTEMVKAILDNRKTQTRRIIHKDPTWINHRGVLLSSFWKDKCFAHFRGIGEQTDFAGYISNYKPGDLLYVRETFRISDFPETDGAYEYRADLDTPFGVYNYGIWKPSIHMPKEAARIWLKITNIRVERLNDISKEDAIAEGLRNSKLFNEWGGVEPHPEVIGAFRWYQKPIDAFKNLWEFISGDGTWKENPWVWVIEFERIEKP